MPHAMRPPHAPGIVKCHLTRSFSWPPFGASALGKVNASVDGHSRWIDTIDAAAQAGNPALVALLAGLGMQGDGWDKMTPRYLFHIVSALNRVGMNAEARMIAAEAVARA